eukprot:scaffold616_cov306-Pavlova_lutheri.AAC.25
MHVHAREARDGTPPCPPWPFHEMSTANHPNLEDALLRRTGGKAQPGPGRINSLGDWFRPTIPSVRQNRASTAISRHDGARQSHTTAGQPVGRAAVGVGGSAQTDAGATASGELQLRRVPGTPKA